MKNIIICYNSKEVKLALTIDSFLKDNGYNSILLDEKHIKYNFDVLNKIVKDDDVIISIISDDYLKSFECMSLITTLYGADKIISHLITIKLKKLKLNNVKIFIKYLQYWQTKTKEFGDSISLMNDKSGKFKKELSIHYTITKLISHFLSVLVISKYDEGLTNSFRNKAIILKKILVWINDLILQKSEYLRKKKDTLLLENVKLSVSKGELKEAFVLMKGFFNLKELAILESRYSFLQKERKMGLLKSEEYILEINRITKSIVELIWELESK